MQKFVLATRICSGDGALDELAARSDKRVLLVTDRFFVENGTAAVIAAKCVNAEVKIFDEVQPDPPLALVAKGVAVVSEFRPNAVIALGGGSAIDCAKGIVAMSETDADLIAIPTTSGTGSEVTAFAVLSHESVKHPLIAPALRPKLAILDDSLLQELPPTLIADAGMDIAAHCLEALASKNATPLTDAMALHSLKTVLEKLPSSYRGDKRVRGEIHCAATMAGIAFDNAGLGLCHAVSHALGGRFHLAHGRLNGILLPAVLRYNTEQAYRNALLSCGFADLRALILAVERLRRSLELPSTLTQAGLRRTEVLQNLDSLCAAALNDRCTETNPRAVTKEVIASVIREVL